jgi:hypothetical protein
MDSRKMAQMTMTSRRGGHLSDVRQGMDTRGTWAGPSYTLTEQG